MKRLERDDRYIVYKDGRVERDAYKVTDKKGRLMEYKKIECKPKLSNNGYVVVSVNRKWELLHRLVAEVYLPNEDGKKTVNHIDGNKLNNRLDNLEWSTHKENQNHAEKSGLTGFRGGVAIEVYDDSGKIGEFKSISKTAKCLNLDRKIISAVSDTKQWYRGYRFKRRCRD